MMSKLSELCQIILNCYECNWEKLKEYYPPPYTPARILQIKLDLGIGVCVIVLIGMEKYHWEDLGKEVSPEELIKQLIRLINNTRRQMSAEEHVLHIKAEINEAVLYLQEIKETMKSKALQDVEERLKELLKEEI